MGATSPAPVIPLEATTGPSSSPSASADAVPVAAPAFRVATTPTPKEPRDARRIRQGCRLTTDEYARLGGLKKRAASLDRPMKRGDLLRVGLHALLQMPDAELFAALDALQRPPAR